MAQKTAGKAIQVLLSKRMTRTAVDARSADGGTDTALGFSKKEAARAGRRV